MPRNTDIWRSIIEEPDDVGQEILRQYVNMALSNNTYETLDRLIREPSRDSEHTNIAEVKKPKHPKWYTKSRKPG